MMITLKYSYPLFCLTLSLLLAACSTPTHTQSQTVGKVETQSQTNNTGAQLKLETFDTRRIYLETIFQDDQKVRGDEDQEIQIKFGRDSKEFKDYMRKQKIQDSINLVKVEKYLAVYGHPKKEELGEIAAQTR
jgi:hypothetical protein